MPAKAKYTKQVITLVEPAMREQLDQYAKDNQLTLSQAVRRAIIAGLPLLETPAQPEKPIERVTRPESYVTFGFGQPEFFTD